MDIASLLEFRRVNLRAREMIGALRQYRAITDHALGALCATLKTGLALWVTALDLFATLCTPNCSLCGNVGGFICLLSCTRCCYKCLQDKNELTVVYLSRAKKAGLSASMRISIRVMYTISGKYGEVGMKITIKRRRYLVAEQHVIEAFERARVGGNKQQLNIKALSSGEEYIDLRYKAVMVLPYLDLARVKVRNGIYCHGYETWCGRRINMTHFASNVHLYLREGFLEHFRWCPRAQKLWTDSHKGTLCSKRLENVVVD